jgi:hypothetical protein
MPGFNNTAWKVVEIVSSGFVSTLKSFFYPIWPPAEPDPQRTASRCSLRQHVAGLWWLIDPGSSNSRDITSRQMAKADQPHAFAKAEDLDLHGAEAFKAGDQH